MSSSNISEDVGLRSTSKVTTEETDNPKIDEDVSTDSDSIILEPRGTRGTYRSGDGIGQVDAREIERIATALSLRKTKSAGHAGIDTIIEETDPAYDPASKHFDVSRWIEKFIKNIKDEGMPDNKVGIAYKDLNIYGSGAALQLQETVGSLMTAPLRPGEFLSFGKKQPKHILRNFDGLIKPGEMLIVLGRPGSGCSTLLKTMCGELHGLKLDKDSTIHYDGIPQKHMAREFRGEISYNKEVDHHFPHLTVGQTLEFAANVKLPDRPMQGMPRKELAKYVTQVVMAIFGLTHTYNTKVGNDFIRGVSGGERKRVSIAEMVLAGSALGAWDNSTRGLDSATALKFVDSLRLASDFGGTTNIVAIYQASQDIYDRFDKTTVLYEGRQIYFGPAQDAKAFFERQGWYCPQRQTTGDFLTSITNPAERQPREGMENQVPRTAEDFERYWRESPEYQTLLEDIAAHEKDFPIDAHGENIARFREGHREVQSKHVRKGSPYMVSIGRQTYFNTIRAYQRIWGDKSATLANFMMNVIMALIIGSIFYGQPETTDSFFSKGSVLFIAILLNGLSAMNEINSLFDSRPIIEKHHSYAFYHPATEAAAGIVADIPIKFIIAVLFNIVLYFLAGLRVSAGSFFLFFLITFMMTFVMSGIFRTIGALASSASQALAGAGIMILALVIYTGFVIPIPQMKVWFSWIRWINPIFYGFEILVANEFHNRNFTCAPSSVVPPYQPTVGNSFICSVLGAVAGETEVSGDAFIAANYEYYYSHVWRNFGILCGFLVAFMALYFIVSELNSSTTSSAEVLVFQRGHAPADLEKAGRTTNADEEMAVAGDIKNEEVDTKAVLPPQTDIFTWRDVVYDIDIKGEQRRLLDNVAGWVKPGTLTALMGVSGAGKTTLLDVLAQRTTMGVITGDMLVNGRPQDASFQRKTGYVQQQDLHLETSTVRESLRFSAMLRQPASVSKAEKYKFVEEVIDMLGMRSFANAVVGHPGMGLNVEQRKLLTIGVELAAKPKLLLFLDEPTSGLDSQSSWTICNFLRKLADSGQAVLCTIHQPSAILFEQFDRLLFLAKGGKTVYFGDIGKNSRTLLDYFEQNGGRKCDDSENPAEYMIEVVNKGSNASGTDWHSLWKDSPQRKAVNVEIDRIHAEHKELPAEDDTKEAHSEFAMPFSTQLQQTTYRVFQQYWRTPSYIFAKFFLGIVAGLFIGFTFFNAQTSQAGMSVVIFSVFMLTTIFNSLVQQIQPLFISQRSLYEVREKPSKAYSWKAFMLANIVVEIPYQIITGILTFGSYYYAVNGVQSSARQVTVLLFVIQLYIYAAAFAQMTIAALPDAQTSGALVTLLVMFSILFNGVLQKPSALPGFWIFMYRLSPFTYWIGGIVATQLHGRQVVCAGGETQIFNPPSGQTCEQYLQSFLSTAPGVLENPNATSQCSYCPLREADQYIAASDIYWSERWRNFGIFWAYIFFNFGIAILTYYLFRVAKWNKGAKKTKPHRKDREQPKPTTKETFADLARKSSLLPTSSRPH